MKHLKFLRVIAIFAMAVVTAWGGAFYAQASPNTPPDSGGSAHYEHYDKAVISISDCLINGKIGSYPDLERWDNACDCGTENYARIIFCWEKQPHRTIYRGICYKKQLDFLSEKDRGDLADSEYFSRRCGHNVGDYLGYTTGSKIYRGSQECIVGYLINTNTFLSPIFWRASAVVQYDTLKSGKEVRHV